MRWLQLAFLCQHHNREQLPKTEADALQQAHLDYLKSLWTTRKALAIGPFTDGGRTRGIAILDVPSRQAAYDLMKRDPLVKSGQLYVNVISWYCMPEVFKYKGEFMDIAPMSFGILKRPKSAPTVSKEEGQKLQEQHMANINRMAQLGGLLSAGPLDGGAMRGIFIFDGRWSKERIAKECQEDPLISRGVLKLDLYTWFTAKGNFDIALPE